MTATLYHATTARRAGSQCTARPVTTDAPCNGCVYQSEHKYRSHIIAAAYHCERCDEPICADHLRYHERVELFLCGRCFTIATRARRGTA
jgi:hypothetical protein